MHTLLSEVVISFQELVCAVVSYDWRPANSRKLEEHLLRVFDLKTGRRRIEFPVLWDEGGDRVCFSSDSSRIFVGCYEAHGLACYDARSGNEVWRRKDLKSIQQVAASPREDLVFCGRETGASHIIEGGTGKTVMNPRGAKEAWFSPFDDSALLDCGGNRDLEIHRPLGTRVGKFVRASFGVVHVAFSKECVALAEANQPLRAIGLRDFVQVWQLPTDDAHTCEALAYSQKRNAFVVAREKSSKRQFQDINAATGTGSSPRGNVVAGRGAFFGDADYFVDAQGTTYSVASGKKLKEAIF